jgi:branched-chain amino acid transport system permease protein
MALKREFILFGLLGLFLAFIFTQMGTAFSLRMMIEASCYAIIALGLTIQWGYAGLFNIGIMGFIAVGGFLTMLISFPINEKFWNSEAPGDLAMIGLYILIGAAATWGASQLHRIGFPKKLKTFLTVFTFAISYLVVVSALDPVASSIESKAGFIGGLGLPVFAGWVVGAVGAGVIAYYIGRICLGLRSDYLAIATLGIAEIIKAVFKNVDWLTNGTLTVSPLPWPVPTPNDIGFVAARAGYLAVTTILVVVIFLLLQRAYHSPWGRMMRAIRDNEISSAAMGKDVNKRRLEIFVVGSVLMGLGGAALITSVRIFDPSGFLPLNHTFLIWVMVILGGSGNNLGAIFGAIFVYIIWVISEPTTIVLFEAMQTYGKLWFDWDAPSDLMSRALQMRVFVIGLTITLVLRFAPQGVIPEKVAQHG